MTNTAKASDVREALREQGFEVPDDLQKSDSPDFHDGLEVYVWETFWILSNKRIYNDGYPRPISISEVFCYLSLVPPIADSELDLIVEHLNELDTAYLNIIVPRLTKERESPK